MQLPRSNSWQLYPLTEGHLGSQNSLVPMELSIMPARGLHALLVPVFYRIYYALFLVCRIFLIVKPDHLSCAYDLRRLVYGTITRIWCLKRSCHVAYPKNRYMLCTVQTADEWSSYLEYIKKGGLGKGFGPFLFNATCSSSQVQEPSSPGGVIVE